MDDGHYLVTDRCKGTDKVAPYNHIDVLVGHNIKFDLHYLSKHWDVKEWMKKGGMIWDTMVAEYVLSGMSKNNKTKGVLSLDALAEEYGLPLKDDNIKEYFAAGMGADEIPEEEILPYLQNDVEVTASIFKSQADEAIRSGMMPLLINMMEATLATWLMEAEGAVVNRTTIHEYKEQLTLEREVAYNEATRQMEEMSGLTWLSPTSDKHLSTLLFGGKLKHKEPVVIIDKDGEPARYKSGKKKGELKTRMENVEYTLPRILNPSVCEAESNTNGYSVTDAVLSKIQVTHVTPMKLLATAIKEIRRIDKEMSTYVDGYLNRIWHDGKLHPEYQTCMTDTGRLSCTNPNLQNIKSRDND